MTLSVSDLCVGRAGRAVLAGVGFRVVPGTALVLRGPNGSGKTTLLRTIAGLTPALSGQITLPPDGLAWGGHLNGLKAQLSVAENLSFWARAYGARDIGPALEAFDLTGLADRRVAELSAGQTRRTGLAKLLVTGRKLWLLDEPTVSLDAQNTARFGTIITDHLAAGGMALLATHIELGFEAETLDLTPLAAPADFARADDPFAWDDAP